MFSLIWVIKLLYELKYILKRNYVFLEIVKWFGENGCMIRFFIIILYFGKVYLIIFGLLENFFRCKVLLIKSCRRSCVEEFRFRELIGYIYSVVEYV